MKRDNDKLIMAVAEAVKQLMGTEVQVLVDSTLMGKLANFGGINLESPMIWLFYPRPMPGFGSVDQLFDLVTCKEIAC